MAYTQAQLFALESAIALGATQVKYPDGTEKTYRSLEEMQQIRRQMLRDLGQTSSNSGRKFAQFSKGL